MIASVIIYAIQQATNVIHVSIVFGLLVQLQHVPTSSAYADNPLVLGATWELHGTRSSMLMDGPESAYLAKGVHVAHPT